MDIDFHDVFRSHPGPSLIARAEPGYAVVDASDAYFRAALAERKAIVGRSLFDVFPYHNSQEPDGDAMPALRASLARAVETKKPDVLTARTGQLRRPAGNGSASAERHWTATSAPILAAGGQVVFVLHCLEDSTELFRIRRAEEIERAKLAEANCQFQAIYDQGLFAGRLDLQGVVTDVNRSSLAICGYVREQVVGKPFWECGWWNRSAAVQGWVKAAVEQAVRGLPFRGESKYFWADGRQRIVDFACMPIKDDSDRVQFVVATGMDVTERVHAEDNLQATRILDSITEGFAALDRDWRFTYLNREARSLLHRERDELIASDIWTSFPGLAGSVFEGVLRHAMTKREPASAVAWYPDHSRWYDVHAFPESAGISVYFRDVTREKQAEIDRNRLVAEAENERRVYEAALSNTPDLVYVFDLDHRFTYANEALLRMWGRSRADALGRNCLELGYEPWHAQMHDREIEQVIATRQPIRGEVPFAGTNGRRVYDYIFVPVFGADDSVVAVAGTTRDITDRQKAEQDIREQAQRLSEADRAKDEFLATLSHELRNPLAPLRNSLHLLRLARDGDTSTAPIHEMMERQVNHLVRLVDDLLEVSRISRGTFSLRKERVGVAEIVRNAIETTEPAIRAGGHRLAVALPEETLAVEGDPVRLAQILANLLSNAAKYTDDGGNITVSARREGRTAAISVRDTGVGIAADALPQMFQMFTRGERASNRGQGGLGVGLALARRLAQMHGGTLDAVSAGVGSGSEFTLRVPLAEQQSTHVAASERSAAAIPPKRILVVDDNRDAADSLGMILKFLGADVRLARDGPEALDVYQSYDPGVVLLDIGLPGMDGYEVARRLRARFPERKTAIVALTGWGQDKDRHLAKEAGFDHHLLKPAEIGALQMLLASLDSRQQQGGQ